MKFFWRVLSAMNSQRRLLLLCCVMILLASIGGRLYVEFAARTGSRLYHEPYNYSFSYTAPFIGPFFVARYVSEIQLFDDYLYDFHVVLIWVLLFGIGVVAWRLCAPWLTYSLVVAVAVLVLVGELFWIRMQPDARGRVVPLFYNIDIEALSPFVRAIGSSQTMVIFEGLPRDWGQPKPDLTATSTFESHGHQFYSSPVSVSADDAATLLWLASAPSTFLEWRGMKMCFGFHPDWMIRWISNDGTTHDLLLCFGCSEAIIYSTDGRLYYDLGARNEFKAILDQYTTPRAVKKEP